MFAALDFAAASGSTGLTMAPRSRSPNGGLSGSRVRCGRARSRRCQKLNRGGAPPDVVVFATAGHRGRLARPVAAERRAVASRRAGAERRRDLDNAQRAVRGRRARWSGPRTHSPRPGRWRRRAGWREAAGRRDRDRSDLAPGGPEGGAGNGLAVVVAPERERPLHAYPAGLLPLPPNKPRQPDTVTVTGTPCWRRWLICSFLWYPGHEEETTRTARATRQTAADDATGPADVRRPRRPHAASSAPRRRCGPAGCLRLAMLGGGLCGCRWIRSSHRCIHPPTTYRRAHRPPGCWRALGVPPVTWEW